MIRTVTALFDDTGDAEGAFDTVSRRLAVLKGAIVTCGPGEKPDFGTMYLNRAQREACEAELEDGGSLLIVQVEGDAAAEQAVDLLDKHVGDDAPAAVPSAMAPAPVAAPIPAAPPPAAPRPAIAAGNAEAVPISTLSRKVSPVPPEAGAVSAPVPAATLAPAAAPEPQVEAEERIPVVEEELRIGKRSLVRGGARVHSYMEEVPVTETIELLEERTSIERRPVNRRLSEEEIAASGLLQDRVVEVAQMREEAIVTKEAFVREELVVKKTVEKRVEQVHETVRRTAVEVERLEPALAGADETDKLRG
jgi:stress response protein YsnF